SAVPVTRLPVALMTRLPGAPGAMVSTIIVVDGEAALTLPAASDMFDVEPDVGALLYGEER
ncbi:hypothetical protein ONK27_27130, partial [Salmonella enterica subsp. enterica serovar Virginia]|nr:hypothetical protein [Salmonella enterica subsp. enterica serovar Virginia]